MNMPMTHQRWMGWRRKHIKTALKGIVTLSCYFQDLTRMKKLPNNLMFLPDFLPDCCYTMLLQLGMNYRTWCYFNLGWILVTSTTMLLQLGITQCCLQRAHTGDPVTNICCKTFPSGIAFRIPSGFLPECCLFLNNSAFVLLPRSHSHDEMTREAWMASEPPL